MFHKKKLKNSRRQFLNTSMKFGAMISLVGSPLFASENILPKKGPMTFSKLNKQLKILILGGTSFLGPHQIAYAKSRGHKISIFTRGKTKPTVHQDVFEHVEHLVGDRENDLEALKGKKWDAVIDNSGRKVAWTKSTAELLKDHVGLYMYTSSTGVYYPYLGTNIKEDTKLVLKVPENINEEQSMEYGYGVMKANSENIAKEIFGKDRTILVRPTYMMGPGDRTDRFTYWPVRLALGGEILVPGKSNDPVQYIDVRDVAEWMIRLIEERNTGTYNAAGPASKTGMHAFVYGAHAAFSSEAKFVSIDDYDFLKSHKIYWSVPWIMPIGENAGSAKVNIEHSKDNGLTFRPLAKSVVDIHDWWYSDVIDASRRDKLMNGKNSLKTREDKIIAAWKAR